MTEYENLQFTIEKFWDVVPPVWGLVRGNVRANATKDFNLTLIQFHMLRHIRAGAQAVSELAERQQISRPAVSQAIEQLVSKNLVTRTQDTQDRRYVQLTLTAEGNSLLDAVFRKSRLWMEKQMSALTLQDLQTLNQAFELLNKAFKNPAE